MSEELTPTIRNLQRLGDSLKGEDQQVCYRAVSELTKALRSLPAAGAEPVGYRYKRFADDRWRYSERRPAGSPLIVEPLILPYPAQSQPEIEALRKDTERLDSLTSHGGDTDIIICPPGNHGGPPDKWLVTFDCLGSPNDFFGATLREAIDASMAK